LCPTFLVRCERDSFKSDLKYSERYLGTYDAKRTWLGIAYPMEIVMKKIFIATAALSLMCGSAFAQSTGPAAQGDNMTKPGMTNGSMEKGSMDKGGTTGMNNDGMKKEGMANGGMKKDMSKDGSPSDDTMKKNGKSN
jgi:pentapeptide MXKDX repeat protein